MSMSDPHPIRLRESTEPLADGARVIDADFKIVGRRRQVMRRVMFWLGAFALAAIVGFLIPPVWVAVESVTAALAG
ncbi:hypothetical protein U91I_00140 [alpha proteobacterium U9-1i]|nr:hypothetical protein U91I_00140 [alpha proteobacterium U9-1i]